MKISGLQKTINSIIEKNSNEVSYVIDKYEK